MNRKVLGICIAVLLAAGCVPKKKYDSQVELARELQEQLTAARKRNRELGIKIGFLEKQLALLRSTMKTREDTSVSAHQTGGSPETSCRNVCERLSNCSDDFAEFAGKGMPKAAMETLRKQMKKQFADTDKCIEECRKDKTPQDEKNLEKCMPKSDCRAFAECFMKAVKDSKKQSQKESK